MVGEAPSLAEIAWMPKAHRFELMDWPMDRYPNLVFWHDRVKGLASYEAGIVQWEPPPARKLLAEYARSRGDEGYHVRNFGVLAAQ